MSVCNIQGSNCQIEREFEYIDARGREARLLVNIEICVSRGYAASRNGPREPACADFVSASYRDAKGIWRDVKEGEWLDLWVRDVAERLEEHELLEAVG